MKIYYIKDINNLREGISNHDYKITGMKQFRIWLCGSLDVAPIRLIIKEELIKRTGWHDKLRLIEVKQGAIQKDGAEIILNATLCEKNGAIVFWDCTNLENYEGLGKLRTENAELILRKRGYYRETLLCVIYPGGRISATYQAYRCFKHIVLDLENDALKLSSSDIN